MKKNDGKSREVGLEQLKSHLKEEKFANCYLIHGEEGYLRDFYFQQLKGKIIPTGMETFNLHEFNGKDFDIHLLEEALDSFPMMAERTLVVVTDCDLYKLAEATRTKLISLLEDLPEYCTLLFYYDIFRYHHDGRSKLAAALDKFSVIVECPFQNEEKLIRWIQVQRFPALGKNISTEMARELIFYCGGSMTKLVGEIEKIGAYAIGDDISKEDIIAVATPHINAIVFNMTDALSARDFDTAIGILSQLFQMEGKSKGQKMEKELGILGAVSRQMRQLYQAKLAMEEKKGESYVASLLGVQTFIARRIVSSARNFSLEWCRNAVILCGNADRNMKSTSQQGEALLTQLVLDLALA